jgi:anion-transporting  ArsA/GET3 family ATPase
MDPAQFFAASRVIIVAGKGGVGKSTVSAALARTAARAGLSTLIVEIEGKSGLGAAFGRGDPLTYDEVVLSPGGGPNGAADVRARTLTPDDALLEYLADHGMRRVSKRLVQTGALDVVATAVPGIKDILVLGKIKQLERSSPADLIIVDAPAAGHAVTFLTSASGLLDAVRVGPIRAQAQDVVDLLSDPARCQVLLVTLPEETPVNEVVDTAFKLEDRVGVALGGVVVNGLYPPLPGLSPDAAGEDRALADAARFRLGREQIGRAAGRARAPHPG